MIARDRDTYRWCSIVELVYIDVRKLCLHCSVGIEIYFGKMNDVDKNVNKIEKGSYSTLENRSCLKGIE